MSASTPNATGQEMNASLKHLNRNSTPARTLTEPAPDDTQLKQILEVALSAPDHGRLRPYRFIAIRGDARYRLSEIFVQATMRREPDIDAAYLARQREKPLRSPLIIVVVANLVESEKVPEIEQMLSAGAAAHNILLAGNALGFGSIWLTGANAYDDHVRGELGIADNERIVGFVHLGTSSLPIAPRDLPGIGDFLSDWE